MASAVRSQFRFVFGLISVSAANASDRQNNIYDHLNQAIEQFS